jgi:hypothetical protein
MVTGNVGNIGDPEFKLLQEFTSLESLKLEKQQAALESDMGKSWHNVLAMHLQKGNRGLVVRWGTKSVMANEASKRS